MKPLHYLLTTFLLLCLAGCGKKVPSDVIQPEAMKDLLYDYHMASAMGSTLPYSENYKKKAYYRYVFEKHHVTEAEFDSSMVWYTRHSEELATIYEDLHKRLENEESAMKALVARKDNQLEVSMSGDTVDIWQDRTLYWLTASPLTNKVLFDLKADTSFKERDGLELKADFHFVSQVAKTSGRQAVMGLTFYFSNDSVQGITRRVQSSGIQRLYLRPDSAYEIRSVAGFIYYADENKRPSELLLNNIKLTRFHIKDLPPVPADTLNGRNIPTEAPSRE